MEDFSLCLAQSFGSAFNIVASSLDTHDEAVRKYKKAKSYLIALAELGADVWHGIDATQMNFHLHENEEIGIKGFLRPIECVELKKEDYPERRWVQV